VGAGRLPSDPVLPIPRVCVRKDKREKANCSSVALISYVNFLAHFALPKTVIFPLFTPRQFLFLKYSAEIMQIRKRKRGVVGKKLSFSFFSAVVLLAARARSLVAL